MGWEGCDAEKGLDLAFFRSFRLDGLQGFEMNGDRGSMLRNRGVVSQNVRI